MRREVSAMKLAALILILTLGTSASFSADIAPMVPEILAKCVEEIRSSHSDVELYTEINPFYLRGDFDGDSRMDYVAQIVRPRLHPHLGIDSSGLVFCLASGRVDPMGAKLGPIPEDADRLLLISPSWEALPPDSTEVTAPGAAGDVVVMAWEDGTGVIYMAKGSYRWRWIE